MLMEQERKQIVKYSRLLLTRNLTRGTGGNISIFDRKAGLVAITPSGVEYDAMRCEDIPVCTISGEIVEGSLKPSSETGMHLSMYQAREDFSSVVHTHSTYATVLSCMHEALPAVHYLIGFSGACEVPCIRYLPFGSEKLACEVGSTFSKMATLKVLLLGNHGLISGGASLDEAFSIAEEIEFVSEIYYRLIVAGKYELLDKDDMVEVMKRFRIYGQKQISTSENA